MFRLAGQDSKQTITMETVRLDVLFSFPELLNREVQLGQKSAHFSGEKQENIFEKRNAFSREK